MKNCFRVHTTHKSGESSTYASEHTSFLFSFSLFYESKLNHKNTTTTAAAAVKVLIRCCKMICLDIIIIIAVAWNKTQLLLLLLLAVIGRNFFVGNKKIDGCKWLTSDVCRLC
jgi:hypothetical protein